MVLNLPIVKEVLFKVKGKRDFYNFLRSLLKSVFPVTEPMVTS